MQKANFLHDNDWYDVEPFNSKIHKRSVGSAHNGDHIILQRRDIAPDNVDYECKLSVKLTFSRDPGVQNALIIMRFMNIVGLGGGSVGKGASPLACKF